MIYLEAIVIFLGKLLVYQRVLYLTCQMQHVVPMPIPRLGTISLAFPMAMSPAVSVISVISASSLA